MNYGDSSVTFEVTGEAEHVTGDTEGLLGLWLLDSSFLNNGFGGSGWAVAPNEGGNGLLVERSKNN